MWFEFFSSSFSATTLGFKTEVCGRKQLGKNKTRNRGLFANAFHQISKQNAKKFLVFISSCQISRSFAKSSSFQALFLKRLKEDIMNSITFEVAISKNKRARHVVENNRFVLAGFNVYSEMPASPVSKMVSKSSLEMLLDPPFHFPTYNFKLWALQLSHLQERGRKTCEQSLISSPSIPLQSSHLHNPLLLLSNTLLNLFISVTILLLNLQKNSSFII